MREAIAGAFAQTYQPLEIVLSDDCSTDETYEIMKEMAEKYTGPHKVAIRQNSVNAGTLRHVQQAVEASSGELIVIAAGDDVSRPNRVARLYETWSQCDSWAVFSDFAEIDDQGKITAYHKQNDCIAAPGYRLRSYMNGPVNERSIVHGATSAYDRSLFQFLELSDDAYILSEDGALSLLLHILNKDVSYIREPLVEYRVHDRSLTNSKIGRNSWSDLVDAETKIAKHALSQSHRCSFILEANRRFSKGDEKRVDEHKVFQDYKRQQLLASWWDIRPSQRLKGIIKHKVMFEKWALPRILPMKIFLSFKYVSEIFRRY